MNKYIIMQKKSEELTEEINKINSEQIPKDIEFNNLCDDYEKLKQELDIVTTENVKLKNDLLKSKENPELNIKDNNPINTNDDLYEEVKKKKVEFDEESRSRAMTRIKRMKEKQKEEKDKLKVRKSVKVSNIVKALEESMRNHNSDNDDNKGK